MRKWILPGLAVGLLILLAGCGTKPPVLELKLVRSAPPAAFTPIVAGPGESIMTLKSLKFSPPVLEVTAGTKVIFVNADPIDYSVVEGDPEKIGSYTPLFKSEKFNINKTFSYTFDKPGTYKVFCDTSSFWKVGMRAEVVVK